MLTALHGAVSLDLLSTQGQAWPCEAVAWHIWGCLSLMLDKLMGQVSEEGLNYKMKVKFKGKSGSMCRFWVAIHAYDSPYGVGQPGGAGAGPAPSGRRPRARATASMSRSRREPLPPWVREVARWRCRAA